jgi:hypothetical protein
VVEISVLVSIDAEFELINHTAALPFSFLHYSFEHLGHGEEREEGLHVWVSILDEALLVEVVGRRIEEVPEERQTRHEEVQEHLEQFHLVRIQLFLRLYRGLARKVERKEVVLFSNL